MPRQGILCHRCKESSNTLTRAGMVGPVSSADSRIVKVHVPLANRSPRSAPVTAPRGVHASPFCAPDPRLYGPPHWRCTRSPFVLGIHGCTGRFVGFLAGATLLARGLLHGRLAPGCGHVNARWPICFWIAPKRISIQHSLATRHSSTRFITQRTARSNAGPGS